MSSVEKENVPGLGELRVIDTYVYYDGPRLFAAESDGGQLFIVVWIDETEEADEWLYAPISPGRLSNVSSGEIDVRSAFVQPDGGTVYHVSTLTNGSPTIVEELSASSIREDWLPRPGELVSRSQTG
jgi:hypothetical protein